MAGPPRGPYHSRCCRSCLGNLVSARCCRSSGPAPAATTCSITGSRASFTTTSCCGCRRRAALPGRILVVATNCNGGVKEILCFDSLPDRGALWHHRCPDNDEFAGELPPVLDSVRTLHWFDPCELLRPDARSEYRPEARERQAGGGWQLKTGAGADLACARRDG